MIKGKIIDVKEDGKAIIEAPIDITKLIRQNIKECYIDYIDSRSLSDQQRKMCYALINSIADWSGSSAQDIKEYFKIEFWTEHIDTLADKVFSLSNAPMSLVAEFQRFLINFILENDIPTKYPLLDYVDDIDHYVYMCLIHKKCAICGKKAELHHMDGSTVGMGNDRTQISHIGREVMSLCNIHHQEYHNIGGKDFLQKYHLNGGIIADKTICKIYKLHT